MPDAPEDDKVPESSGDAGEVEWEALFGVRKGIDSWPGCADGLGTLVMDTLRASLPTAAVCPGGEAGLAEGAAAEATAAPEKATADAKATVAKTILPSGAFKFRFICHLICASVLVPVESG